jgi:ATP-dependent Clp protease ATP-binding subunit ClpX
MSIRANKPGKESRCSWCDKSQGDVALLIATPTGRPRAHICDECVAVCNSLLKDRRTDHQSDKSEQLAERKERAIFLALKEARRLGPPVAANETGGPGL